MKQFYTFLLLILTFGINAQVGIGTTLPTGALDVQSTTNGIVIPRIALTSRLVSAPVVNPQGGALSSGTLIWNTATAGTSPNNVVPGFYYWNSGAWNVIAGVPSKDWTIGGDAITDPALEFIGTTTSQDFRIRTNNSPRFDFTSNGRLRAYDNGLVTQPTYSWIGDENTGMWRPSQDFLAFSTNGTDRLRIPNTNQIHAMSLGTALAPFYSFSADDNTGVFSASADNLGLSTNGTERLRIPNTNQIHAMNLGTALLPFYSFSADSNTGLFSASADVLGLSTNGLERLRIPNAYQVHAMSLGTASLPFYTFSADTNTGIYSATADVLNISTAGLERMRLLANGQVSINSAAPFAGDQFSVFSTGSAVNGYGNQIGIYGQSTSTNGIGVYGLVEGTGTIGVVGTTNAANSSGIFALNYNANGTSLIASGNNILPTYLGTGSGGAFTGRRTGVYSFYNAPGDGEGMLIQDNYGAQWNVGAYDMANGGYFKIIGDGTVSTIVNDLNNKKVVMHCTETPSGLFEDYGVGKLVNGRAKVIIDPILAKNIKVSAEFPMKVFIQLEGECNGVYVTNKSAQSFEVIELQNGNSNASFSYSVVANRADETYTSNSNGNTRTAVYSQRFSSAPAYQASSKAILPKAEVKK